MPIIVGSFHISILSDKTPKYMRFAMEDMNMKTAYNCRQFPFLHFKRKNAKKHVCCNGKPQILKLPTILGIFRI